MTWYRIEGNLPQHHKYAPLSDAAFRLAITAGAWCATMMTDGLLPKKMIAGLTRAPSAKQLSKAVQELVDAKIWDVIESDAESFLVHDYLDWNMSRAQWQAKKAAGSSGGKAKAAAKSKQVLKQKPSKRLAPASDSLEQTASTCSSVPLADSDLRSPTPNLKIPPNPPGGGTAARDPYKPKPADAMRASFRTQCPDRMDFTEAHRGLCKRGSIDIGLEWRAFSCKSQSNGVHKPDWSKAFEGHLSECCGRIERSAAFRATERNAAPRGQTATVERPEPPVDTKTPLPASEARQVASPELSAKLHSALARIG